LQRARSIPQYFHGAGRRQAKRPALMIVIELLNRPRRIA
jgi:hypothetical protein